MGFSGGGQVTGMGPNVCLSLKTNSPKSDLNGSFFCCKHQFGTQHPDPKPKIRRQEFGGPGELNGRMQPVVIVAAGWLDPPSDLCFFFFGIFGYIWHVICLRFSNQPEAAVLKFVVSVQLHVLSLAVPLRMFQCHRKFQLNMCVTDVLSHWLIEGLTVNPPKTFR